MALPGSESKYLITSLAALGCLASSGIHATYCGAPCTSTRKKSTGSPLAWAWNTAAIPPLKEMARSPVLTTSAAALVRRTSCVLINFLAYSITAASPTSKPHQASPAEREKSQVTSLPFHLGSRKSFQVLGNSAGFLMRVVL